MIRLIILFAIFLAVYPMIGDGYAQFSEDFNVDGVFNVLSNMIAGLSEMVDKLNIQYNRSRQAAITKELIEIISGAESL